MNTIQQKIDRSVKFSTDSTLMKYHKISVAHAEPVVFENLTLRYLPDDFRSRANELKSVLVKKLSAEHAEVEKRLVRQAVNEADALAFLTSVPLLLLPALAEEKVEEVAAWSARQRAVRHADPFALAA
jgi:hypothetical protein